MLPQKNEYWWIEWIDKDFHDSDIFIGYVEDLDKYGVSVIGSDEAFSLDDFVWLQKVFPYTKGEPRGD